MAFNPRFGVGPFVSVSYGTVPVVVPATHYVVANPVIVSGPRLKKKPYYDMNDKAPSTTVFVGNIHEKANNDLMRSLLLKCGNIAQWKRVHGTNGRIQAFGFCEFDHPDATLRAVRLLNNLNLGGKKLLIKCDEKTQTTIKEYINKRRTIYGKAPLNLEKIEDIPVEEYFHDRDSSQFHRECRQLVVTANEPDLLLEELPGDSKFPSNANLTSQLIIPETEEAEKDKLGLIEREIKQFRSTHKDEKIKSRHRRSSRSPKKDSSSNDVKQQETSATAATEKENSRPPTSTALTDGAAKTSPVSSRASSKARDRRTTANGKRSRSRETPRVASKRRTTRSRSKSKRRDSEDEEELRLRSRLERKIREKEYAYQERLQKWETRERKKKREYEKEKHNEKQRRKEELREAKKLKEFFEDYDDDTEDPKYYKGKSYEIRRRDYDHEMELDARDRHKEREELEEIRRRLLSEGVENPDVEILRIQRAQEERLLKRLRADSGSESPLLSSTAAASVAESPKTVQPSRRTRRDSAASSETESSLLAGGGGLADDAVESTTDQQMEAVVKSWQTMKEETTTVDGQSSTPGSVGQASGPKATSFGFAGLKISGRGAAHASSSSLLATSAGGASVAAAADDDNDDDSLLTSKRQRPLVKLEYSEAEKQALEDQQPSLNVANMTVEEKRKAIKNLIEKIPTNREELFAYAINWPLVDQILIEKRLKPWVNKKIVEYIGEEEPSLVEFICQKVAEKCPPQTILEDISMVLDEEASVFVIKLWRLLIYEIEAKRFGLVKLD